MQTQDSNSLLQDLPDDSSLPSQETEGGLLRAAFATLPDAVYLFGNDRRLVRANDAATRLQGSEPLKGTVCCEMFWRVEGADTCVVDRALQTLEKVVVEIQSGSDNENSISIIVEPLRGNGPQPNALVIARDISNLRRAEAEAIAHKSFLANIADRTLDEIYALDTAGRITWMNERAQTFKSSRLTGGNFLDLISSDSRALTEENVQERAVRPIGNRHFR